MNFINRTVALCLLTALCCGPAAAAINLGLLVTPAKPVLSLDFGNPTDYSAQKPPPIPLELGAEGTYFHGTESAILEETTPTLSPEGGGPYGGPGDSWSSLTLSSPTPGSTRQTPIVYRFESHIFNDYSGVGYATSGRTPGPLIWEFDHPGNQVYFRVDWAIKFTGVPYANITCSGFPGTCDTNILTSSAAVRGAAFTVEGFGTEAIYPTAGGTSAIGPGDLTYDGTVSGVATNSRLAISFDAGFNVGEVNRGDSRISIEFQVYADVEPLVVVAPPLLQFSTSAGNLLSLSWPASASVFLQQTRNLGTADWRKVDQVASDDGTNKVVVVDLSEGSTFYRLKQP